MYSILRKPFNQSDVVNFAARASAKRNVTFHIEELEETKHAIPERESKYSESQSNLETEAKSEKSYSDWTEENQECKMEEDEEKDEDSSSDYVPSDEDILCSTCGSPEVDDDQTSDYVPSDDESEESEEIEEDDDFDEKVFNILSSLKYNKNTKSKYLFDWGSEYWYKFESVGALKRNPRTCIPTFKRKIKSNRNWMNILNKVKCEVIQDRLS